MNSTNYRLILSAWVSRVVLCCDEMFAVVLLLATCVGAQLNDDGTCRLDPHPSVEYQCMAPEAEESRACEVFEPAGTLVVPRCRQPNYYSASPLPYMRCLDGYWDYVARCTPECGRVTPDAMGLVAGGRVAQRGELPWHAGIYSTTSSPYMQLCGGSLISSNVILSAAHCFWTDLEKQLPASRFAAAVGKLYRPWNDDHDKAQKSAVKVIHLPPRFQGTSANFQDDIALVITARRFIFRTDVRPVCLSFDFYFEQQQLNTGTKGKVAGWGLTGASGGASGVLRTVQLPYVEIGVCIARSPPDYREYITSDKICAGTLEPNSALCRGDSGGGLAFPETVRGTERYYLRGVVSTAPTSDLACNLAVYTSFTALSKHDKFIKQFWIESGEFKCSDGSVISAGNYCDGSADCADGSDETRRACYKLKCSAYLFRCEYGACVDKGAVCNGVRECADGSDEDDALCGRPVTAVPQTFKPDGDKCLLPPYPPYGRYDPVLSGPVPAPGQGYERLTLANVTCLPGYSVLEYSPDEFHCYRGYWTDALPTCVPICADPLDSSNGIQSGYAYAAETGHCYKFHAVAANWSAAQAACAAAGGALAFPNSEAEAALLTRLLATHPREALPGPNYKGAVAVGLFKTNEVWKTVDGQLLEQAGYSRWRPDQPHKGCCPFGLMDRKGNLGSMHAGFQVPYFCEKAS